MTRNNADFGSGMVHVWRGLDNVHPDEITENPNGLGIHWSTDKQVAKRFAEDEFYAKEQGLEPSGILLHGRVHKDNIVVPHTEEWEELSDTHDILPPAESHEEEATIRRGSPVHIDEVEHVTDSGYKPLGRQFKGTA